MDNPKFILPSEFRKNTPLVVERIIPTLSEFLLSSKLDFIDICRLSLVGKSILVCLAATEIIYSM